MMYKIVCCVEAQPSIMLNIILLLIPSIYHGRYALIVQDQPAETVSMIIISTNLFGFLCWLHEYSTC